MKVQIEHMGPLDKVNLRVEGLTLVKGPSNSGKSHIVKALYAAIHNRYKPGYVKKGEESIITKLQYKPDEPILTVVRKHSGSPLMKLGDVTWGKLSRSVPIEVEQYHNFGTLKVGDDSYSIHFHTQFQKPLLKEFSQKRIMEILSASKAMDDLNLVHYGLSSRREQNRGAFASVDATISKYKADISIAKFKLSEEEPIVTKMSEVISSLEEVDLTISNLSELDRKIKDLISVNIKLKSLSNQEQIIGELTQSVKLEQDLSNLKSKLEQRAILTKSISDLQTKIDKLTALIHVQLELTETNSRWEKVRRLSTVLGSHDLVSTSLTTMEPKINLISKLDKHKVAISKLDLETSRLSNLKTVLSNTQLVSERIEKVNNIIEQGLCPMCEQKLKH